METFLNLLVRLDESEIFIEFTEKSLSNYVRLRKSLGHERCKWDFHGDYFFNRFTITSPVYSCVADNHKLLIHSVPVDGFEKGKY